jgi:hypothetical protein
MQQSASSSVDALQGGKEKLCLLMSLSFPFLLADEFNIILFSFNILYTFTLIVDCGLWIKELQIIIKTEIRVHDSVSELVQQVANEPSVGLYFVQQHVHKAVPGLLSIKVSLLPPSLHLNILSI